MSKIMERLSWAFDQASCGDGFEVEVLSDAKAEIERLRAALEPCIELIEGNIEADEHVHQILRKARKALANNV